MVFVWSYLTDGDPAYTLVQVALNDLIMLVLFAPLVLIAHALQISTATTVAACAVYFWARLAHCIVYTLGIPGLRTLVWTVGWLALVVLALAIFRIV